MPNLDIHALEPGDAIVFVNKYYKEGATIETPIAERYDDADYEDHIAMFSHFDKDDNPVLIHSVLDEVTNPSGLLQSTLQNLTGKMDTFTLPATETEKEKTVSRRYDVEFKVFRCEDQALAKKALTYINLWHDYNIPYDLARLNEKIKLEDDGFDAEEFYQLATKRYETQGRFRALKYAVRRAASLTQGGINGPGRGLTCSMAFVLAYQVAELEKHVQTLPEYNNGLNTGTTPVYNSDKYATFDPNDTDARYLAYLDAIKNKNVEIQPYYVSSLRFIREGFDIHSFKHKSFSVDAKCIGVAGIVHLFGQSSLWNECGILKLGGNKAFTTEQKQAYRDRRNSMEERKNRKRYSFILDGNFGSLLGPRQTVFAKTLRTSRLRLEAPSSTFNTPEKPPEAPYTSPGESSSAARILNFKN